VYLPLLFFFNRNPGLYLPLIALQYHEVRLDFDTTAYYNSYFTGAFEVWANYIYLDTEERRRFAQKGHEYLIEQIQHTGGDTISGSTESQVSLVRVAFNHPVKELVWCYQNPTASQTTNPNAMWNFSTSTANVNVTCDTRQFCQSGNFLLPHLTGVPHLYVPAGYIPGSNVTSSGVTYAANQGNYAYATGPVIVNSNLVSSNVMFSATCANVFWTEEGSSLPSTVQQYGVEVGPLHSFKVILNGQDRFKEQSGKYFNSIQPFYHHTGTPYPGIYTYSFALQPEEHQPTGTCNFSRIDNAQVSINLKTGSVATTQKMFAINYNVLRIQSGMGGLAFSN
jgi:hypothetical protein